MPTTHLPEISVESSTQTEQQIRAVLGTLGYDGIETSSQSDQPEKEAVEIPAIPETQQTTESETAAQAGDPAGDPADTPAGDPPARIRKPGSARAKEQALHAKAEADRLRLENEDLKRKLADRPAGAVELPKPPAAEPPKVEAKVEAKPKPNPEDFEQGVYDPSYVEAVADWRYDERERVKEETQRAQKETEELAKKSQADSEAKAAADAELKGETDRWNASAETAKIRFADYDQVMNAPREKPVPLALVHAVRDRDDVPPAELAYWLGKNPEAEGKLLEIASKLPANPTRFQFTGMVKKLDRALDEFVADLQAYEPPDADLEQEEAAALPASRETRAPAASSAPAAKTSKQNPPPAAPAPAAKPKPAVPTMVGGRGTTQTLSEMEKAQRGLPVNADKFRQEWEAKNGRLPI